MKAVIYARFSSDNQREESITAQVRACTDYASRQKYAVLKVYTDEARSATTDDRPGFLRMISDINLGLVAVQLVLVHKLDRFARNRYDSAVYRKTLTRAGVRLIAVDQPLDDSPESVLLESLLEGLAEYYSKNLAREVMKGMRENAFQARFNGGWVPLGYNVVDSHYVLNEREAGVVRLIFSMFLEGYGYRPIQDRLGQLGYVTKRGQPFGKNSIYEILRNPKYCGLYIFNQAPRRLDGKRNCHRKKKDDEIIKVPGAVPAIVSEDDFRKVQEKMNERKKGPRQSGATVYILTGKVVCGKCGSAMVGNSSRRKAGAEPTRYYECNRKLRIRDCDTRRVPKDYLENYVLDVIEKNIFSQGNIQELARRVMALASERDAESVQQEKVMRLELAEVCKKIGNLVMAVEDGALDYDLLAGRLKALKVRKEELECNLEAFRSPLDDVTEEMVMEYLSATQKMTFDRLDVMGIKKIVDLYVHEVEVLDEVSVVLKFCIGADKDGVGGGT